MSLVWRTYFLAKGMKYLLQVLQESKIHLEKEVRQEEERRR
jgi:hypothetical protein